MQDKQLPCVKLLVNVPAGNCRLIREEKLNLPATDGEGQGQDDMANIVYERKGAMILYNNSLYWYLKVENI